MSAGWRVIGTLIVASAGVICRAVWVDWGVGVWVTASPRYPHTPTPPHTHTVPTRIAPRTVRLRCTADTSVSSYPPEADLNFGKSNRLRLKGIEMIMLARFDTAPVRGWRIDLGSIFLHAAGEHRLKTIGVSTVAVDWVEGDGAQSRVNSGATFTWADYGHRRWGGRQSDFTDAALTQRGTVVHYTGLQECPGGWLEIDVPPSVIEALVSGRSYGLAITDEKGQTHWNNDVHSREQSGFEPYMLVTGEPGGGATGGADGSKRRVDLTAGGSGSRTARPPAPNPGGEYSSSGGVQINAIHVPSAGAPDGTLEAAAASLLSPRIGGRGADAWRRGEPPVRPAGLRVWAYGECEKADPVTGNLLEEVGEAKIAGAPAGDYRRRNSVWDGGTSTVRLAGARNEFVAFQLCIEATARRASVRVTPSDLIGPHGARFPARQITLARNRYVRDGSWYPEVAVPVNGSFEIPDPKNGVPGQRNQSLLAEVYVPHDAPAGDYAGQLAVASGGAAPFAIPLRLTVWPFTLPDGLTFDVDLNTYGPPGDAEMELRYHRMAHEHRTTLNILGYNQAGRANPDYVPPLEGSGKAIHVRDWSEFDRRFGRYYDGSAFADLPRARVPLRHTYLPFCEGWPSDSREHYHYAPTMTAYPELIVEHALKAPPIEQAFDEPFKGEFRAIVAEFARHFNEKGWDRTQFQCYMNDKYYYKDPKEGGRGSSWWLLDEPMARDDFLADRFFGRLFKEGLQQAGAAGRGPQMVFRCDVSRPQWQRDWLSGVVNLMCVSGEFFRKNDRCLDQKRAEHVTFWHYGTANDIRASNLAGEAWAVTAYLAGADGILPWQSVEGDRAFETATPTALLYPGQRLGIAGPLASLRLKALRRGQQDVEYLGLLAARRGWSRDQTAAVVGRLLDLKVRTRERFVDDAGTPLFEHLTGEQFARLRAAVAGMLAGGAQKARSKGRRVPGGNDRKVRRGS